MANDSTIQAILKDTALDRPVRVLCVDDETSQLEILNKQLEKSGYETVQMHNGREALHLLSNKPNSIDIVLLDRKLPDMEGLEVIRAIRKMPGLSKLPIIIQSAMAGPEEVAAGIEAGAYYYIIKPYEASVLRSVLRAAVREYEQSKKLQTRLDSQVSVTHLAKYGEFELQTPKEARDLAVHLAAFSDDLDRAAIGLSALMLNAIEHGNLGIGFTKKNQLLNDYVWQEEVDALLARPEHKDKRVHVTYERKNNNDIDVFIVDQGSGFNWRDYMDFDPRRLTDPAGRGIARANAMNPDCIQYLGKGNVVVFTIKRTREEKSLDDIKERYLLSKI